MKQLPPGPALAYARVTANLVQADVGTRQNVHKIEHGQDALVSTYLRCLSRCGSRLVIVTKAGEQVEVMMEGKVEDGK